VSNTKTTLPVDAKEYVEKWGQIITSSTLEDAVKIRDALDALMPNDIPWRSEIFQALDKLVIKAMENAQ